MKTISTLIVLLFWITASFAQMEYEKGYLITNDLQRKNCLIKNEEWKDNPVEFSYKLTDNSAPETGTIKTRPNSWKDLFFSNVHGKQGS